MKAEQKAARQEKATPDRVEKKAPVAQKAQAVQAEKPESPGPVQPIPAVAAEAARPEKPAGIAGRAIALAKASVSIYTVAVTLVMVFMFWLRTLIYDQVFTNWPGNYVNVSADDGVYHMRLLFNTLQHFPFRILYDPFTHFPYGSMIHFGPMYELIPATFLYIVGLGNPSPQLVTTVAAFYPVLLGALVAVPTYYIGKKLFGRAAGLFAVLVLALLPSAMLFRSMLGVTDHHIAEVFFMACAVACWIYALDAAKASKISFAQIKSRDLKGIKAPLIYAALTGLFLGMYLLNWVGALVLGGTLFIYFAIQAIIDHHHGRPLDYLVVFSALMFLIPAAMVLPYSLSNLTFQSVYYSLTQPVLLIAAFVGVCAIYVTSGVLRINKVEKWVFPATVAGLGLVIVLVLLILAPGLFGLVQYLQNVFIPSSGLKTVEEALPSIIDPVTRQYSLRVLNDNFLFTLWTALFGLVALLTLAYRGSRQSMLAFLVWNVVMTVALIGQNRYTYYYGVNAALLTACLAYVLFGLISFDKFRASFAKKVDSFENLHRFLKKNIGISITISALAIFFIFIAAYPALPISDPRAATINDITKQEGVTFFDAQNAVPGMPYMWYDALTWMRNHTPDPQGSPVQSSFNYAGGQYYPPANYGSANYSYPASAYGVMSWWDYGHDIEYVAQRIPNANPFQAGISEQNGTTGASPFFCSTDENRSVQMLDKLGSRYVIIDNQMATGKFYAIQQWIGDTDGWDGGPLGNISYWYNIGSAFISANTTVPILEDTSKWNSSIMNRLYYGDADGMSHYRLVYESAGDYYINVKEIGNGQYLGIPDNPLSVGDLENATQAYEMYSQHAVGVDSTPSDLSFYIYGARPPVKWVKIFEKVAGATITGSAPDGSSVTASLRLKNDDGREFNYTATTTAHNGAYSFVVPYPTEPMKGDGYSYGVTPETAYTISYGNTTRSAGVPESAVMNGGTIRVA